MSGIKKEIEEPYSFKKAAKYSTGQIADQAAYQTFTFLVFTFYFAVVQLSITLITVGFIIWAFWNSFNDPHFSLLLCCFYQGMASIIRTAVIFFLPLQVWSVRLSSHYLSN